MRWSEKGLQLAIKGVTFATAALCALKIIAKEQCSRRQTHERAAALLFLAKMCAIKPGVWRKLLALE
jgi:hypothetical protein